MQTSVAISSGLSQNPGHTHHRHDFSQSSTEKSSHAHSSPRTRPTVVTGSPSSVSLAGSSDVHSKGNKKPQEQPDNIKKSTIRVDAFLGEWLTPDYFELITPPPSSIMMVAGAKADLLRREDYSNLIHMKETAGVAPFQGFPGGWGSPVADKGKDDGPFSSLSSLAQALPRRDRTSSLSSSGTNGAHHTVRGRSPLAFPAEHGVYQPPVPNYAISNSDAIPAGYVAHARDACDDIDYQWDSMREPQMWGTGGEYGEEWSSMHKRFRRGLQKMVGWYQGNADPGKLLTKSPASSPGGPVEDVSEQEGTDLVLVLVTHGAGCNALIGALTNQPVLLDVGMASLTMAVRKPTPASSPTHTPGHSRESSKNINISEQYDVKLVANTEHLRSSTASTPSSSRTPSVAGMAAFQERVMGNSRAFDGNKRPSSSTSSNFGSIRRAASVATSMPKSYRAGRQTSIGLWSASAQEKEEDEESHEPEDDMILNFGNDGESKDSKENDPLDEDRVEEPILTDHEKAEEDDVVPAGGLWGSPRPPGYAEKIREIAPKRRWTVNERT